MKYNIQALRQLIYVILINVKILVGKVAFD